MDIDLTAKSDILHNPYFLVKLGRPNGSLGKSKLDGREDKIRRFLVHENLNMKTRTLK